MLNKKEAAARSSAALRFGGEVSLWNRGIQKKEAELFLN